jgi:phosphoribosylformylglycinamidine (FGAM) synthase-like amidotransferase family enzyme
LGVGRGPRFGVVQFPGTNCERETLRALRSFLQPHPTVQAD